MARDGNCIVCGKPHYLHDEDDNGGPICPSNSYEFQYGNIMPTQDDIDDYNRDYEC